jgi:hypothetical protein
VATPTAAPAAWAACTDHPGQPAKSKKGSVLLDGPLFLYVGFSDPVSPFRPSFAPRLANKVAELQATIDTAWQLRGLLPICSYCKRIRNDQNYWERVEVYVTQHSDAKFTHGICPTCLDAVHAEIEAEESSIRKAKETT